MSSRVSRASPETWRSSTAIEAERASRRVDVVLDVRRLARLLVRRDDDALQHRAVRLAADRDGEIQADRRGSGQLRRVSACTSARRAAEQADDGQQHDAIGIRACTSV